MQKANSMLQFLANPLENIKSFILILNAEWFYLCPQSPLGINKYFG